MKKILWLVFLLIVFFLTVIFQANAQTASTVAVKSVAEPRFSIALSFGNSYKLRDGLDSEFPNFNNSKTSSLRFGYNLSRYVEIQGERSVISGFTYKDIEISPTMLSLNFKIGLPMTVAGISLKPYIVKGWGVGNSKSTYCYRDYTVVPTYEEWKSFSSSVSNSKIGEGIEVGIYKDLSLFYEFTYWKWTTKINNGNFSFTHSETLFGLIEKF